LNAASSGGLLWVLPLLGYLPLALLRVLLWVALWHLALLHLALLLTERTNVEVLLGVDETEKRFLVWYDEERLRRQRDHCCLLGWVGVSWGWVMGWVLSCVLGCTQDLEVS
jgi:hypothetical protein